MSNHYQRIRLVVGKDGLVLFSLIEMSCHGQCDQRSSRTSSMWLNRERKKIESYHDNYNSKFASSNLDYKGRYLCFLLPVHFKSEVHVRLSFYSFIFNKVESDTNSLFSLHTRRQKFYIIEIYLWIGWRVFISTRGQN